MLFPPEQLQLILQLTNNELAMARKNYTMAGEIVKFFGVMLLVTQFEFGSWASLWSNTSTNKYIPRWHQVSLELDALPENMELTILQPKAMEVYYQTCGVIDQHN